MPAPTLNQIRTAIAAKLLAVDATLLVHEYERYTKRMDELLELYVSGDAGDKRVHGYHIRRSATREILIDTDRWAIYHAWRIRGFLGMDDAAATEKLFDTEIEALRDAFRADDTLGGLVFSLSPVGSEDQGEIGMQVLSSQPVMFAGVLCHSAELGLTTQHLI